ncbi:MAG: hypothetical protein QNK23_17310 [Crocinitomicaceae bacterium]|nr:hypothetical protein [Crocinitomicaceae bacterium]
MYRILFLLLLVNFSLHAQYNTGYLKYVVQVVPLDTTQGNMNAARLLRKSKIEISFAEEMYRIDSQMGEISNNSIIYNYPKKEVLTLTSNGTNFLAQLLSTDDAKTREHADTDVQVTEYRDSTRKIIGFECFYVEFVENGASTAYWCTEEIEFKFRGKSIVHSSIPGFPLWFRKEENGFQLTYIAANFTKEIDAEIFSTDIPEGYTDVAPAGN